MSKFLYVWGKKEQIIVLNTHRTAFHNIAFFSFIDKDNAKVFICMGGKKEQIIDVFNLVRNVEK